LDVCYQSPFVYFDISFSNYDGALTKLYAKAKREFIGLRED